MAKRRLEDVLAMPAIATLTAEYVSAKAERRLDDAKRAWNERAVAIAATGYTPPRTSFSCRAGQLQAAIARGESAERRSRRGR